MSPTAVEAALDGGVAGAPSKLYQIGILVGFTIREARHKWTLLAIFLGISLFLALLATVVSIDIVEGTIASARLLGGWELEVGGVPIGDVVLRIQQLIIGLLNSFGMFMAIFVSGNVIPRTLEPGWVDLLIAQPLSRATLILGRALGAVTVVALSIAYLVGCSWLILTWKTGFGNAGFLAAGLLILGTFVVCYAGMVLIGVVTRSSVVSILAGLGIWFVGVPLYALHRFEEWQIAFRPGWQRNTATGISEVLYWSFPKTAELGSAVMQAARAEAFQPASLWLSLPFALSCLGLACWWFSRQDH